MKTIPIILIVLFLQLQVFAQQESAKNIFTLSSDNPTQINLYTFTGEKTNEVYLDEKYLIKIDPNVDSVDLFIYSNLFEIGTLKPFKNDEGWYWFMLNKTTAKGDTLSKTLNKKNAATVELPLSIGTNLKNRIIVSNNLTIVFNEDKNTRQIFSMISSAIILLIAIFIIFRKNARILKDHSDNNEHAPYSLSRTQLVYWTLLIVFAFLYIWMCTGDLIAISGQILALLGISSATTIGAKLIDNDDISNKSINRHQNEKSDSFLIDILSDLKGLSIHRLQNVLFSLAIGCYFLYEVIQHKKVPDLNSELMILMGISSGTYLAVKKGENQTNKKNDVPADSDIPK